jgi:NADPH:quinone reductase-like Zn-dependent oxidoreductase
MKAALLDPKTNRLSVSDTDPPRPSATEILVNLKAAALNHRDLWYQQGRRFDSGTSVIMGSDGAGTAAEAGTEAEPSLTGKEVIINPSIEWGNDPRAQGPDYEILGIPGNGTFAEQIALDSKYIYEKPPHLTIEQAAALPLAGLTAYRALFTRGEFEPGHAVLVTGAGGGAALFALQFAVAMDGRVYVTSGHDRKIEEAIKLGAVDGVNYRKSEWSRELEDISTGFDIIIDSAGGGDFEKLTHLAKPGGRIVNFGRTAGETGPLNPARIFYKQLSILGTTMGSDGEFGDMVKLVTEKKITPVVDSVFKLDEIGKAFKRMEAGEQFGKIVIRI